MKKDELKKLMLETDYYEDEDMRVHFYEEIQNYYDKIIGFCRNKSSYAMGFAKELLGFISNNLYSSDEAFEKLCNDYEKMIDDRNRFIKFVSIVNDVMDSLHSCHKDYDYDIEHLILFEELIHADI